MSQGAMILSELVTAIQKLADGRVVKNAKADKIADALYPRLKTSTREAVLHALNETYGRARYWSTVTPDEVVWAAVKFDRARRQSAVVSVQCADCHGMGVIEALVARMGEYHPIPGGRGAMTRAINPESIGKLGYGPLYWTGFPCGCANTPAWMGTIGQPLRERIVAFQRATIAAFQVTGDTRVDGGELIRDSQKGDA